MNFVFREQANGREDEQMGGNSPELPMPTVLISTPTGQSGSPTRWPQ
jgi:hypothetical protein